MIFNTFPDPNASNIPPWNYKRGKEVNRYIEHYADSQKLKQDEAIQVQGSDLIIWNRTFSKRYCTCQHLDSSINNNPAVTEDTRPEVVELQATNAVTSLNSQAVFPQTKSKQAFDSQLLATGLGDLASLVDSLYDEVEEDPILPAAPKISKKQNSAIEEAFLEQKKNLGVETSEYVSCPICFGTRHTDTYQPHRGTRIILDGSDYYSKTLSGAFLNKDASPYLFNLPATGASITWKVTLPKYFKAVSLKAYNLENQSTAVRLEFALPTAPSTFSPLTLASLQSRNGSNNNDLLIRCTYDESLVSAYLSDLEVNISHLEIVLLYCDTFDKGELPMLTIPEQIDFQELYMRSRIVLSPRIETLSRNDLICENKYGLLWQVVDVEKLYTNGGKLMNLRAEIRLVQNSEKLYSLAMFNRKMNTFRNDL